MPSNFNLSDVFLSYSRIDRDFVRLLHNKLKETEREIWVDWEDIPETADWWEEIKAGIEAANTFVFVVSPASVLSPICHDEISHAVNNNKRIVPILYKEVNQDEEKSKIHSAITTYNWIFFREHDDFDHAFAVLIKALETDLYHVQMHTRILVQAREWENKQENDSYLLFGAELEDALKWLISGSKKPPEPLPLHSEYILASQRAQRRRQRNIVILSVFIALILGLTLLAFSLAQSATSEANFAQTQVALVSTAEADANNNAATATIAQGEALIQANIAQTQVAVASTAQSEALNQANIAQTAQSDAQDQAALAATSEFIANNNAATAVFAEAQANNNAATAIVAQGDALLQAGIAQTQVAIASTAQNEAQNQADIAQTQVAIASTAQNEALNQASNAQTQADLASTAEADALNNAATATIAQGEALLQANNAQTQVALVSTAQNEALNQANNAQTQVALVSTAEANANNNAATAVAAQILAANSQARQLIAEARLVITSNPDLANLLAVEAVHRAPSPEISDGLFDIVVNSSNTLLPSFATSDHIYDTLISPDGKVMITAGCVRVDNAGFCLEPELAQFNIETQEKEILSNGGSIPQSLTLSPDEKTLLAGNRDGSIDSFQFLSPKSAHQQSIQAHTGIVRDLAFSPDGSTFASASSDSTVKLWNSTDGMMIAESQNGHQSIVFALAFSADGRYIVSGGTDNQLILWSADSLELLDRQTNPNSWIVDVLVNQANGEIITSGCSTRDSANQCNAGELVFWTIDAGKLKRLEAVQVADNMIVQLSLDATETILTLATIDGKTLLYDIHNKASYGLPFGTNETLVTSLDFVSNNELLVSYTSGGQSIWRLLPPNTSEWESIACLDAKRNLTEAEWGEYFRFEEYRLTCELIPE